MHTKTNALYHLIFAVEGHHRVVWRLLRMYGPFLYARVNMSQYEKRCITRGSKTYYFIDIERVNHLEWVPRPVCIPWLLGHCSMRRQQHWCSQQTPSKFVLRCFPLGHREKDREGCYASSNLVFLQCCNHLFLYFSIS